MLKKILLITILLFTLSTQSIFADDLTPEQKTAQVKIDKAQKAYEDAKIAAEKTAADLAKKTEEQVKPLNDEIQKQKNLLDVAKKEVEATQKTLNESQTATPDLKQKVKDAQKKVDSLQTTIDAKNQQVEDIKKESNTEQKKILSESNDERTNLNKALSDPNASLKQQMQGTQGLLKEAYEAATPAKEALNKAKIAEIKTKKDLEEAENKLVEAQNQGIQGAEITALEKAVFDANIAASVASFKVEREELHKDLVALKTAQENAKIANDAYVASSDSDNDIASAGFKIGVNDISPGMDVQGKTVKESINYTLGTVIQSLMILLGSLALLIMTIGAGFMILHHGQDELLSKGKTIFMSGVYALIVALSSYYLVAMFRFILYSGNS